MFIVASFGDPQMKVFFNFLTSKWLIVNSELFKILKLLNYMMVPILETFIHYYIS
jgi:hypothetical protein